LRLRYLKRRKGWRLLEESFFIVLFFVVLFSFDDAKVVSPNWLRNQRKGSCHFGWVKCKRGLVNKECRSGTNLPPWFSVALKLSPPGGIYNILDPTSHRGRFKQEIPPWFRVPRTTAVGLEKDNFLSGKDTSQGLALLNKSRQTLKKSG